MAVRIQGVSGAKRKMRDIFEDIRGERTYGAVYGVLSQATAFAAVKTPVDTGNLINSYTAPEIRELRDQTVGVVGNTAAYAASVHDKPGTYVDKDQPRGGNRGNMWDPNAEPKFMSKGLEEVVPHVKRIIREAYRPK